MSTVIPSRQFKSEATGLTPKVAKVIRIHPGKNTVDVVCLDGPYIRGIPVQVGWGSTVSGFSKSTAPTVDSTTPQGPTYTSEADNPIAEGTLAGPPDSTLQGNRDIYAVIQQFEGFVIGNSGFICTGFIYGPQGEMHFPNDDLLNEFQDFLLLRHESDVQITIDKWGALSAQHPSGARFTLAEQYATNSDDDPATDPVDIEGLDVNAAYALRNNKTRNVKAIMRDSFGARILLNADGSFTIDNPAGVSIKGNADGSCDIAAPGNINVVSQANIGLKAAGDITLEAGAGVGLSAATDIAFKTAVGDTSVTEIVTIYAEHVHHLGPAVTTPPDPPTMIIP